MLLQSGALVAYGSSSSSESSNTLTTKSPPQQPTTVGQSAEVVRYLDVIQDTLKEGWTVHTAKDGRLYYCK